MAILTLIQNNKKALIPFEGAPVLKDLLAKAGYSVLSPCGGKGKCLKCAVKITGDISAPGSAEINAGCRLACRTVLYGDATAELLFPEETFAHIQTDTTAFTAGDRDWNYGAAVDIGTTTVVLKLFSADGICVGEESALNPQRSFSADVIGRIGESLKGNSEKLKEQITNCVFSLLTQACDSVGIHNTDVDCMVIAGNTAMLYLLTGTDPSSIARAPFISETLFGKWTELFGIKTYLAPCMNAFVGGDITAAVLESGMWERGETALLCDMGTNGEIALWKNGVLYVTSTAAGPAFEGAEISCGCGGIIGAVHRVWAEDGNIYAHTLGNLPAVGICGSGLIDAVAAFIETERIDKTGTVFGELDISANGGKITLLPADIRALILAKAAVAAGIEVLLARSGTDMREINTLYLAGGFGSKLNISSAAAIGLVPFELEGKVKVLGNAALSGAVKMLFDKNYISLGESIAKKSVHVELGGNDDFNNAFIDNMFLGKVN